MLVKLSSSQEVMWQISPNMLFKNGNLSHIPRDLLKQITRSLLPRLLSLASFFFFLEYKTALTIKQTYETLTTVKDLKCENAL